MQWVPVEKLNRLAQGNHQGAVALTASIEYVGLHELLESIPEDETPLLVVLDGVTDVRNFGAIARSAECAGAHGLVTSLKSSAPVNAESMKSSAGALSLIPVCRAGSIRGTLKILQSEGFRIVAATEKSDELLFEADLSGPTAIVMGSEDTGISKEVLKLCDMRLAIPIRGSVESLNVSAAAAVMLFEAVRQRTGKADPTHSRTISLRKKPRSRHARTGGRDAFLCKPKRTVSKPDRISFFGRQRYDGVSEIRNGAGRKRCERQAWNSGLRTT